LVGRIFLPGTLLTLLSWLRWRELVAGLIDEQSDRMSGGVENGLEAYRDRCRRHPDYVFLPPRVWR
jgi:hypothetical protein